MEDEKQKKAFVDTTVLADSLLKVGGRREKAAAALASYDVTSLPVYAVKEFVAGPLANYIYAHNVFVNANSYSDAISRIQKLSMTPQRYKTSTSLEAVAMAEESIASYSLKELVDKYGETATDKCVRLDEMRLSIQTAILVAWKKRRTQTTEISNPLSCYLESEPVKDGKGILKLRTKRCKPPVECCMANQLRQMKDEIEKLFSVVDGMEDGREKTGRRKALRHFSRTPSRTMNEDMCIGLGDAVFALFCPSDSVILTTNQKDHEPLAAALGKSTEVP